MQMIQRAAEREENSGFGSDQRLTDDRSGGNLNRCSTWPNKVRLDSARLSGLLSIRPISLFIQQQPTAISAGRASKYHTIHSHQLIRTGRIPAPSVPPDWFIWGRAVHRT